MNIDAEVLIEEVKKRAALYDTTSPFYNDRAWKKELWEEVCKTLDNKLETYDAKAKVVFGKEVQKRWHSLRDCFRRELYFQKSYQTEGGRKKAKYKYFDALSFLLPFTKLSTTESSESETFQDTQENEQSYSPSSYHDTSLVEEEEIATNGENSTPTRKRYLEINQENIMEEIVAKNTKREHTNNTDDVAFLMSLLPTFNDLTMQEKLLLRIELMQTIMRFRESRQIEEYPTVGKQKYVVSQPLTLASTSTCNAFDFSPQITIKDEPTV